MWVKICGIREFATAEVAAAAGADAIGLNFYAPSPRSVSRPQAVAIARQLAERTKLAGEATRTEPIGLFVNSTVEEVCQTALECQLTTVQLHGDESPEYLVSLAGFRLIRAFRVGADGLGALDAELARLSALNVTLDACLVDAQVRGAYGGTGQHAPWDLLAREWPLQDRPRLILAGGLTPGNVGEAIAICRPWGVDVAGGVESSPGVKSPDLIRAFIENARSAS